MDIISTISTIFPVILLVATGFIIRRVNLLKESSIQDIKSLVVNLTLPLVLFHAFGAMDFQVQYLVIVAIVFLACTSVMFLSLKLATVPGFRSPYIPFLMAGFEAGMLGYAIFGSSFGQEQIPVFAVVDLGQVIFVFFVLVTRLEQFQGAGHAFRQTMLNFVKTPVIIAIFTGIIFNITGAYSTLLQSPWGSILFSTTNILANLTMPLIAIVIGYGISFKPGQLYSALRIIFLRLTIWVFLAYLLNFFVIKQWLRLDPIFEVAVLIMAILPAPFVIPIYVKDAGEQGQNLILNTLSLGTILTLLGVVVIRLIYG